MAITENAARVFSITEAAEASGLSAHTLRYYEWKIGFYKERLGRA